MVVVVHRRNLASGRIPTERVHRRMLWYEVVPRGDVHPVPVASVRAPVPVFVHDEFGCAFLMHGKSLCAWENCPHTGWGTIRHHEEQGTRQAIGFLGDHALPRVLEQPENVELDVM